MSEIRENGFYIVQWTCGEWTVAEWEDGLWYTVGSGYSHDDADFMQILPNRIQMPENPKRTLSVIK